MLNWLFKKRRAAEPAAAATAAPPPAPQPTPQPRGALWQARLDAARGDDDTLLVLAREAPILEIKLAAVDSLAGETALKAAEREFRSHDRRVHRLAKQRLDAVVTRRESRTKAAALIDAARALGADAVLPLNRLAQIGRDWQALDASVLDAGQADAFATARAALDVQVHAREAQRQREREARQAALAAVARAPAPAAIAAGNDEPRAEVPAAGDAGDAPAAPAAPAAQAAAPETPAEADDDASTAAAAAPAVATLPDTDDTGATPSPLRRRPRVAPREQVERITQLVVHAEAAAAEGQLAPLAKSLAELDSAVDALGGSSLPAALRERRQVVASEFGRLRSWQQWGSARAVDALVDAAQALAKLVSPATEAQATPPPPVNLDAHAAAIRDLRARWKALAHQHAAAGAAQRKRFDAALQVAYAPLAERQAEIDAQRRDNLAARTALLDTLDALAAEPAEGTPPAEHWRALGRALDRFRADWRALGPLEHRVPREARPALRARMRSSAGRLEAPLERARAAAAAARESLIGSAEALAQDEAVPLREAAAQARDLQAEWARQSRELPLAHAVENTLWTRFRAAIDGVYARRDAAVQAADAERAALVAEREALIARLATIDGDTPTADARRTLAEVDVAWRDGPDRPRGAGNGLQARYAQARAAVQALIDDAAGRRWRSICDTLVARLASCEAREAAPEDTAAAQAPAATSGELPPDWDSALTTRWMSAGTALADRATMARALLRLEVALDLPSPPELVDERRALKLNTLKDTLEGRATALPEPVQRAQWLLTLIAQPCADAAQRARLKAIIDAVRALPIDTLDLTLPLA